MKKRILLTEIYNSVPTIPYEGDDQQLHTEANGYECDESTNPETNSCPCHEAWWQRHEAEQDETGTHAPDCRCSWCEPQERNATVQCADGSWW
jgi:hypothetical protein